VKENRRALIRAAAEIVGERGHEATSIAKITWPISPPTTSRRSNAAARGELTGFEPRELEVLAYILMAARFYMYLRFSKTPSGPQPIPDWVVKTYMKFITHGLRGPRDDG
jgi:hypothetical protein